MEVYQFTRITKSTKSLVNPPDVNYAIGEMGDFSADIFNVGTTLEDLARDIYADLVARGKKCSVDFVNKGDNFVVSRVVRDINGILHVDERRGLTGEEYQRLVSCFFNDSYVQNAPSSQAKS